MTALPMSCIHRAGCPKPNVCTEVGHCTSQTREGLEMEQALASNERVTEAGLRHALREASAKFDWLAEHHVSSDFAKQACKELAHKMWNIQSGVQSSDETKATQLEGECPACRQWVVLRSDTDECFEVPAVKTSGVTDLTSSNCIHRAGCPKPDVCREVGHCTSMSREDLTLQRSLASNEQGPLWTPTLIVERLLRQARLSTSDQITMDRKQLEGLLFDVRRCRNDHSVGGVAVKTPAASCDPTPPETLEVKTGGES